MDLEDDNFGSMRDLSKISDPALLVEIDGVGMLQILYAKDCDKESESCDTFTWMPILFDECFTMMLVSPYCRDD